MPTASVLINNYNYARYLGEAIDSVLEQTFNDLEVVVVDDGSTDNSLELLEVLSRNDDRIKFISKENGGQLSCFNQGFLACKGEYIFFLDADDSCKPTYIEEAIAFYESQPVCDFLFVEREFFDQKAGTSGRYKQDTDFGATPLVTLYTHAWIGNATSCISVRRSVLERVIPLPFEEDWVIRADDCLIWASSIAGARKCYMHRPLVNYRVHGNNAYHGIKQSQQMEAWRKQTVDKLFEYFKGYENLGSGDHGALLLKEFIDRPATISSLYRNYKEAIWRVPSGFLWRMMLQFKLFLHHMVNR